MSRLSSMAGRRAAPRLAAAAAVAGFRPRLAAVAVAAAFSVQPQLAQAQPRGAQVIHGGATATYSGADAVVRTTNGSGTAHSAINWQSFSVPAGSITQFIQPSASSTSINRVVGADPSAIYGTLWSNGNLVLVNPHGIAVGAGAVVDTNGFTASTLPMTEADAIAGRMVFQGAGGPLAVDGQVLARGGDVVLVGSSVQAGRGAVVQSEGATILAAGERVEVTGRGLEGIRMEVKAGNRAVNLGTLKGDAVGIFAGTLRHSGQVEAVSTRTAGGKVVLRAEGDVHVDGSVVAMAGNAGGRIDVLGDRIALEGGALLRASGPAGGGQVRVGGDYQGASAGAPNARRVYMDANARIEADATDRGNGGRVIVWSDEVTRMHGNISARGGAQGGDGGFVEVSGKDRLEFTGLADLRAASGSMGTLLLDPEDILIVHEPASTLAPCCASSNTFPSTDLDYGGSMFEPSSANPATLTDRHLNLQLASSNVRVRTSASIDNSGSGGDISMSSDAVITWSSGSSLMLEADRGMTLAGRIEATGTGGVYLKALGGDITQPTGGLIKTGNLVADATGRVSLLGANQVGTLAGTAGGEFFVKNAQSLRVGTASTGHMTRTSITAGSVRLETTAAGADITVDETIQATSGGIVVDAKGSVKGDGVFNTNGGTGGSVYLHGRGGDVQFSTIATGGASGAQGGSVTVMAQRDVMGDYIRANGGNGSMGAGGRGGTVNLKFGRELVPRGTLAPVIEARGGTGGIGDSMPGGNGSAGGEGGLVTIERTAGDLVVAGGLEVSVRGGDGGGTGSGTGAGGAGGKGGRVIFQAPGKTIIDGASVDARGGSGGSASISGLDGTSGVPGYLETRSAITEVRGWLQLGAIWDNARVVSVLDGGEVYGSGGVLRNAGELHLTGTAYVTPGRVENSGLLKVHSGTAYLSLAKNAGTVEVAAGSTLDTEGNFPANHGALNVNGTLLAGDEPCVECEYLAGLAAGPGFRNEAGGAITGTGEIVVSGGSGTLYNAGKIAPGGVGTTGRLRVGGNLVMESGSVLAVDLVNRLTHDVLEVTGGAAAGGMVEVNHPAGSSIAAGDTFAVVQSAMLDATSMPGVSQPHIVATASGNNLLLRSTAPVPAPSTGPSTTQQQVQQQVVSQVVTFQQLFEQEQEQQDDKGIGRDDIVVTDTACTPR